MLNRQTLLDIVKKGGYEGQADLDPIKKWAAENNFEIQDDDGKAVDFDAAWAQKAVVKVPKSETPDPAKIDGGIGPVGAPAVHVTPERRAYKSWIAHKRNPMTGARPVCDDVDHAEFAGAALRLALAGGVGIPSYEQKSRDTAIVNGAFVGKAMATSPDSVGGGLVPIELAPMLIELKDEYGLARRLVGVTQTTSGQVSFPRLGSDVTVYAVGEAAAITESSPTIAPASAVVKKFAALSYLSAEILTASAIGVVDLVARSHARGLAQKEDQCYFIGDGTGTYNGIVGLKNGIGSAAVVQGSGNSWSAITAGDLTKLQGYIEQNAYMSGQVKIACSQQAFFEVFDRLADAKGGVTLTESQTGKPMFMYRGTPVEISSVLPSASASGVIFAYIGAFSRGTKFVERVGGMRFAASEHYRFNTDQIAYRSCEEIDIVLHDVGDSSNFGQVAALKPS